MQKYSHQQGSAHVVAIVGLVIALAGALGWIFWQNVINKAPQPVTSQPTASTAKDAGMSNAPKWVYKEYSFDACIDIRTPDDVAQLDEAGPKLKKYLTDNVGKEYTDAIGETRTWIFGVCSYYGDYAEGAFMLLGVKNSLVGPKDGTGDVDIIDGSGGGFSKSRLEAAKVPKEMKRVWENAIRP